MKAKVINLVNPQRGTFEDVDISFVGDITEIKYSNGKKESVTADVRSVNIDWGFMSKNVPTYVKAGNNYLNVIYGDAMTAEQIAKINEQLEKNEKKKSLRADKDFVFPEAAHFEKVPGIPPTELGAYMDIAIIIKGVLAFWRDMQKDGLEISPLLGLAIAGVILFVVLNMMGVEIPLPF